MKLKKKEEEAKQTQTEEVGKEEEEPYPKRRMRTEWRMGEGKRESIRVYSLVKRAKERGGGRGGQGPL